MVQAILIYFFSWKVISLFFENLYSILGAHNANTTNMMFKFSNKLFVLVHFATPEMDKRSAEEAFSLPTQQPGFKSQLCRDFFLFTA